jgi:hypothetical protein
LTFGNSIKIRKIVAQAQQFINKKERRRQMRRKGRIKYE